MIQFFAPGVPRPAGSKRAFINKHTGRANQVDMSGAKGKNWRAVVSHVATEAMAEQVPLKGPLGFTMIFVMPRPRHHYGTGRNAKTLKASAPKFHTIAPDTTKLIRAAEDALASITWSNDAEVAVQHACKVYGDKPGAHVWVYPIDRAPSLLYERQMAKLIWGEQ